MTRWILLILVFLIAFLARAIATMPLGFVLERAGLERAAISWSSSNGSVFDGTIASLSAGAQPIGDISLKLQPGKLLQGLIAYDFVWVGVPGRGEGQIAMGHERIAVSDLSAEIRVQALVGLADDIRRLGGIGRIADGALDFANGACRSASGLVSTDTLSRAAASYGQAATDLTGALACDGDMISLPLSGALETGDRIETELRAGLAEVSSLEARVETTNPEIETLLVLQGFQPSGDVYIYRRELQLAGAG